MSVTSLPLSVTKSPNIRPNLPRISSPFLLICVLRIGPDFPPISSFNLALLAKPNFFSTLSLVLLSGVSIPMIRTLSSLRTMSKPKSISTSTVSPSITLMTLHLYSYIITPVFLQEYLS